MHSFTRCCCPSIAMAVPGTLSAASLWLGSAACRHSLAEHRDMPVSGVAVPKTIHEIVLLPHHFAPVRTREIARDFSAERCVCRHAGDLLTFVTFGFRQKHGLRSP